MEMAIKSPPLKGESERSEQGDDLMCSDLIQIFIK
jgi:hypothetical protein